MMTRKSLRLLDLPSDLVVEILSRVPARSLRQLRITCKRCNALFKDENFIKKHLEKAAKQCMVLMLSGSKVYSMTVDHDGVYDDTVVGPQTLLNLNDFHCSQQIEICKIFHCSGLLLCPTGNFRLVVWNPCTGQNRWIPHSGRYKGNSEFALGYENNKSCQTFKILRYSWDRCGLERQLVDCGIYDFESHSWRDLNDRVPKMCTIVSKGVSLKGNIYWIAEKIYEEYLLLSFDFSTEKFKCLSIPSPSINIDDDCVPTALAVVKEERLSVLYLYRRSFFDPPKIEIWMTTHDKIDQTKDLSWSKFLSVELDDNNPHHHKRFSSSTTFFIDEKKKAAVLCDLEYIHKWNRDMEWEVRYFTLIKRCFVIGVKAASNRSSSGFRRRNVASLKLFRVVYGRCHVACCSNAFSGNAFAVPTSDRSGSFATSSTCMVSAQCGWSHCLNPNFAVSKPLIITYNLCGLLLREYASHGRCSN
ncbi:hypothetical protein YC2023_044393 [Brassica napus]